MSKKYCYLFTEGNAKMRELLGGKGANLAEMTNIGLPVPQGFTITTEACTQYYEDGRQINDEIMAEIMEYIEKMEKITGKKFGDHENPLLVSVRSGARASMPGMMDTILNLGLNEDVVDVIAKKSNNPRWAWDCYRRFIQMYSDVVMEVGKKYFEQLIDAMKEQKGVKVTVCENTAAAARMVAESGRDDVAALSSRACRELYGLDCLAASVQDQGNNFTRFICIAKNLEIYPGADRTSLMMVLPHHPGSLYKVLSRFNALGVNMNKLESRPMPDRNFEFMFYFDLETSVYAPQFTQLMGELPELCEEFTYLGSYSEVV